MLKIIRNFVLFLSAVLLLAACQQQGGSGKKSKTLDNTKKAEIRFWSIFGKRGYQ